MPGCLLHNQEISIRGRDGRIIPKTKNRIFNFRSESSQPNQSYTPPNVATPQSQSELPRVILYKPTVPNTSARHNTPTRRVPTNLTLRDIAEAKEIVNRAKPSVSPTAPPSESQFEPPPPYNDAVMMQVEPIPSTNINAVS
ncbi:hypothetical protein LOD99_2466 [Oopsacas minuta]|uniref:Uncharacterized protein n=1 Tax=Oopsacas minuta TaxID=111878 RepID=A0AAV7K1R5_9METZ|nr:hypothetical protein LOD99_2466 [Oopsacas minuta]